MILLPWESGNIVNNSIKDGCKLRMRHKRHPASEAKLRSKGHLEWYHSGRFAAFPARHEHGRDLRSRPGVALIPDFRISGIPVSAKRTPSLSAWSCRNITMRRESLQDGVRLALTFLSEKSVCRAQTSRPQSSVSGYQPSRTHSHFCAMMSSLPHGVYD